MELKDLIEKLNKAFVEFKSANDERITVLEQTGTERAELKAKVETWNKEIDTLKDEIDTARKLDLERLDNFELKLNEQGLGGAGGAHDGDVKAEAKQFYNMVNGQPVPERQIDVEGYVAYKQAFNIYLRRGDKALSRDLQNAMSVGSDPDGGQWVPASTANVIIKKIFETSPVRSVADVVTIGTDRLELPKDINEATSGGWVGETATRSATATPEVGMQEIPVHEQYAMPEVTQKLLDDAVFDIESWLSNKVADVLVRTENTAFCVGTGVASPRGFASYTTVATADSSRAWGQLEHVLSGTSGAIPDTPAEFISVMHKLKQGYRDGAVWAMNKATLASIRQLAGGANDLYYFIPDMAKGPSEQILGYPVVEFEDMADAASGALPIAFGNFKKGYQLVDRIGIRVLRDPYTNKPYVRLYTTKRVGGDVTNFETIKFIKCTA